MPSSVAVNGEVLSDGSDKSGPVARASHSASIYGDKMYVFGGQDDDNNKLGDLWEFDMASSAWRQLGGQDGEYTPIPRSGHTSVVSGDKLYIFGGIYRDLAGPTNPQDAANGTTVAYNQTTVESL